MAGFLSSEYAAPVTAGSLFVSTGSSQALDYVCQRFTQPGDTVVVEEPSYFLAFQIFRDHGLRIVPVPTDADGMDIAALENVLTRTRPALLYTIPSVITSYSIHYTKLYDSCQTCTCISCQACNNSSPDFH